MNNIIRAIFESNNFSATATRPDGKPIYQYNYGQILQIHGLDLPKAVEIHFSNIMGGSDAIIRIGTTTDKITEVAVPEKLLEAYSTVTAYIYVSDTKSGQTEYKIQFLITQRAKPEMWGSPEDGELFQEAIEAVNTSAGKAEDAAVRAEESAGNAEQSAQDAEVSATAAKTSETTVKNLADGFSETAGNAKVDITNHATQEKEQAISAIKAQGEEVQENISESVNTANTAKTNLETAISNANTAKTNLTTATDTANTAKTNLVNATSAGDTARGKLETATANANKAKSDADTARTNLQKVIDDSASKKTALETAISNATSIKDSLDTTTETARTAKSNLETAISNAGKSKAELEAVITSAGTIKSELSTLITQAQTAKSNLDSSVQTANSALTSLQAENTSANSNLDELRSENFNSQAILTGVADLKAYLGLIGDDVLGVEVDFANKTSKRLAGASTLSAGADFDAFSPFGGRRRCNASDDGTITAYYGDESYKEDGSNGQVMVYQPKFYYLTVPVVYDLQEKGVGYHLRKANYYVTAKHHVGFRLHPAFYDANGNEIDYILLPAFEGSLFDTSENAYLMNDEQVMNASEDLMCSIAGVKPASGLTQNLTRPNVEQMARNRGQGWYSDNIKATSANQMLMLVELGMFNTQTGITNGVVFISDNSAYNCSSLTGSTSELGNASGKASQTINEKGGVTTTETANGKTSVSYRGMENPWGNIWNFVYGINIWGNAQMDGGEPYICSDFNFVESKHNDNYEGAGFYLTNANGFVSAFGYSQKYDWLFLPSEALGNSSLPVGDYAHVTSNLNGYRIALLSGSWDYGGYAGAFYWSLVNGVSYRYRFIGGRLVYVPTATA